jgi:hypothetical protein
MPTDCPRSIVPNLNSIGFAAAVTRVFSPAVERLLAIICLGLWLIGPAVGQKDESLTRDFAKLNAKERSRLAEQEAQDATADTAYQGMMARAETAFKNGAYEEARQGFTEARERRPLNVYPKVKLEDLDALIAKRAAEKEVQTEVLIAASPVVIAPPDTARAPVTYGVTSTMTAPVTEPKVTPPDPAPIGPVRTERKPAVDPAPDLVEGERTYMEGKAKVLEITVIEGKRSVSYKKVQHPWGQIFYFQDGDSIGERVWRERFGGR